MNFDQVKSTLEGKKVLVTGHTGFKGSWLSVWLTEMGAEVIGYALQPEEENGIYNLTGLQRRLTDSIIADIRNLEMLEEVFNKYKPDLVFHLAAQPLVRDSYKDPKYNYEVNVIGTVNVLEAIRKLDKDVASVIITTDKCYENKEWLWGYRENDPLGGHDPYSASKACCELIVSSYKKSFLEVGQYKKPIATVRAGNVVGGGDWANDRIVPDCIRALQANQDIIVRNPRATRPWQHVLEPLWGYLLLAANLLEGGGRYSEPWNFGSEPQSAVSVEGIVSRIIKNWGKGTWIDTSVKNAVHEAQFLSLDISKAKALLNWYPCWDIDKTIEETVCWYKYYKNTDGYELCKQQITEYINALTKGIK